MKLVNLRANPFAVVVAIMSIVFLTGCEKEDIIKDESLKASAESRVVAAAGGQKFVANEVLVKFKAGISENARANVLNRISAKVKERILTKTMESFGDKQGLFLVHTPIAVLSAVSNLKSAVEIEYAEPNYTYQHNATSNDTYYTNGSLWGMYGDATKPTNKYGSQAGEAWAAGKTGSATVVVGVIDEGIQFDHPDLLGQVWTNPYDPVDGVDNDKNGYIDDIHGWDFDGNNNSVYDGGILGIQDNHGTHVAGTIGAKRNGTGVVGVNWKVTMISCKFLGPVSGTTANAIKAIDYLTDLKARHGLKIVATNNSWGGGGYSQSLYNAIERSKAKQILFIAAAGNDTNNNDQTPSYPASYTNTNIISVASITSSGSLSSFSNYGKTSVDIGAPGSGIYSTVAYNKYASYDGTSMATPHVTGAVALYMATRSGLTAAQIKTAILGSAVPTTSLSGKCVTGGRLNVSRF